jgi:hypothetical protein
MESSNTTHQQKTKWGNKRFAPDRAPGAKPARGRRKRVAHSAHLHPAIEPVLKGVFNRIGKPPDSGFVPMNFSFKPWNRSKKTTSRLWRPRVPEDLDREQAILSVFKNGGGVGMHRR